MTSNDFNGICRELGPRLYSYARRHLPAQADAEDLAQESLFRLYQAMRQDAVNGAPKAYAFSIAHRLIVDYFRSRSRPSPPADETAAPARDTEHSLLHAEIVRALERLPNPQRQAVLLREYGELSYAEIGEILGMNLGQVKITLHRARRQLAQLLDRDGQFVGEKPNG